jgi:hypothetical protein
LVVVFGFLICGMRTEHMQTGWSRRMYLRVRNGRSGRRTDVVREQALDRGCWWDMDMEWNYGTSPGLHAYWTTSACDPELIDRSI